MHHLRMPPLCTGCASAGKGRANLPWHRAAQNAGTHLRHAHFISATLRYLLPQVVVQVNGCDTPTLGAVVDVVSAQASSHSQLLLSSCHTPSTEHASTWYFSLQTRPIFARSTAATRLRHFAMRRQSSQGLAG